jgi:hypothetical protein
MQDVIRLALLLGGVNVLPHPSQTLGLQEFCILLGGNFSLFGSTGQ